MKKTVSVLTAMLLLLLAVLPAAGAAAAADSKAVLIIDSYKIKAPAEEGVENEITIQIKNTSTVFDATQILLTFSTGDSTVVPVEGNSNQLFIEEIKAGETAEVSIPILVARANKGYGNMTFNFDYISDENRYSNSCYVVFAIAEEKTIEVRSISVVKEATVGAKSLVSLSFKNTTGYELKSTNLVVEGAISGGTRSTAIGNIAADKLGYGECSISFDKTGMQVITVSLTYLDDEDVSRTITLGDYEINVSEPVWVDQTGAAASINGGDADGSKGGLTALIICAIVVVAAAGGVYAYFEIRKRKQ